MVYDNKLKQYRERQQCNRCGRIWNKGFTGDKCPACVDYETRIAADASRLDDAIKGKRVDSPDPG